MATSAATQIFVQLQRWMASRERTRCASLKVSLLVLDDAVRAACANGRCTGYNRNYMCPPYIGTFADIRARLALYDCGALFQKSYPLDNTRDVEAIVGTQRDFHSLVMDTEAYLTSLGVRAQWGMVGGQCVVCLPCTAAQGVPCAHPEEARNSLESIGVKVLSLAKQLQLDSEFHDDKIVWTGCVLWQQPVSAG